MKQAISPLQLTSLNEISRVFKCSVDTVKGWFNEGAPIHHYSEKRYGADYHQLNSWLIEKTNKNERASA